VAASDWVKSLLLFSDGVALLAQTTCGTDRY